MNILQLIKFGHDGQKCNLHSTGVCVRNNIHLNNAIILAVISWHSLAFLNSFVS